MASSKPQQNLSYADAYTFFFAGLAGILGSNMTWLALLGNQSVFLEPLRAFISPGLLLTWVIAGDSNGYIQSTGFTPWIAIFNNAVIYALAIMIPRLLWCHLKRVEPMRANTHARKA